MFKFLIGSRMLGRSVDLMDKAIKCIRENKGPVVVVTRQGTKILKTERQIIDYFGGFYGKHR